MVDCILFNYRNKVDVNIHYSWINSVALGIIRIISLALMSIRFFAYLDGSSKLSSYQFIYLTFYGFVITWIYFICVVFDLVISRLIFKSESTFAKFIGNCINVIFEIALQIQLTLTLLFWTLLVGPDFENLGGFDNLGVHLIPFVLLFLDFALNSYQFPYRHFICTTIVAIIYIIINQVHACNQSAVYQVYQCGNVWIPAVAFVILAAGHMMGHLVWKFGKSKKVKEQLKIGTVSETNTSNSLLQNS